jgi:hypothetical protein
MSTKNNKQRWAKTAGAVTALGLILVTYNQCIIEQKSNAPRRSVAENNQAVTYGDEGQVVTDRWDDHSGNTSSNNPPPTTTPSGPDANQLRRERVFVGIKNFEQINQTMSAVTGVPITLNAVRNIYRDVASQLPTDNDIKSFAANNQVAITKLAAEYCHHAVETATIRSELWPEINFGQAPSSALTAERQQYLVQRTISRFWGEGVLAREDELVAGLELRTLVLDLLNGMANNAASTRTVVKGVCVAALGSVHLQLL